MATAYLKDGGVRVKCCTCPATIEVAEEEEQAINQAVRARRWGARRGPHDSTEYDCPTCKNLPF